jgi:hypothetical protein
MDYKQLLGVLAVAIGIIGYAPYFLNIYKNKTKPHAFSWLVWGVLTAIAFAGQVSSNAGAGAWVTGFTALVCIVIFLIALVRGKKDFPLVDWLCLIGAGLALALWAATNNPLTAIVLVTVIDMLGFFPTFRKSYFKPSEETLFTYTLSGIKFLIGIVALKEFSLVTVLYPASLVITNLIFVSMVMLRRKKNV